VGSVAAPEILTRRIASDLNQVQHGSFSPYAGDEEFPIHLVGEVLIAHNGEPSSIQLELHIPLRYPDGPPRTFEVGGLIPRGSDRWHLMTDNSLCLGSRIEVIRRFRADPTIRGYLDSLVFPYLHGYMSRNQSGVPPQGELPHGAEGTLKDYQRILNVEHPQRVLPLLAMLALDRFPGNQSCPCGSGKKLKRCHLWRILEIKSMQTKNQFAVDALDIQAFLKASCQTNEIGDNHVRR
jgi:hypothetical protein